MPELPEVETVRAGLARHVMDRTISQVEVLHPRAVRRQHGGPAEFCARVVGRQMMAVNRRGKYLWVDLGEPGAGQQPPETALLVHLGMSGQLLVRSDSHLDAMPVAKHLRVRLVLDDGSQIWFVDQRTFGHVMALDLVPTLDGHPGGAIEGADHPPMGTWPLVPTVVAHIARDLLDPHLDRQALVRATRAKRTEIKRALLDQSLISGVGNIYADEALWRAKLHGRRGTDALTPVRLRDLFAHATDVEVEALAAGGTSFDELYVNVNGISGYFSRSLNVYGRAGQPCNRCGRPIRREQFMNRSSYLCRTCQRLPRIQ